MCDPAACPGMVQVHRHPAACPGEQDDDEEVESLSDEALLCRFLSRAEVGERMQAQYSISKTSEIVGRGSFGLVVAGISANGVPVAVKLQFAQRRGPNPAHSTWSTEGPLWEDLQRHPHPNIVHVLDIFVNSAAEVAALVMEAASMDLRRLMKASPGGVLPPTAATSACIDALCGLRHLHSRGIMHRDFKPGNLLVFLAPVFQVRLADMGSARQRSSGNMTVTVCTAWYRAPELFALSTKGAQGGYSLAADMWSFGAVAAEATIGQPIFGNVDELHVLAAMNRRVPIVADGSFDRPPGYDVKAIQKMTENRTWSRQKLADIILSPVRAPLRKLWDASLQHCLLWVPAQRKTADEMFELLQGSYSNILMSPSAPPLGEEWPHAATALPQQQQQQKRDTCQKNVDELFRKGSRSSAAVVAPAADQLVIDVDSASEEAAAET